MIIHNDNLRVMSGFEKLEIYRLALEGVRLIYLLIRIAPLCKDFSLVDQLKRAAVSVVANIAEGYGRRTKKDRAYFITVALGSDNEVMALLDVVKTVYPKIEIDEVRNFYDRLGKQIWKFRSTLYS